MIEKIQMQVTRVIKQEFVLEVFRNRDFHDRQGYNPSFLGRKVPLPALPADVHIALNSTPGPNGAHYLDYRNFSVLFDATKKLPVVTAVNITGASNTMAVSHEQRSGDKWYADDRISKGDNTFQYGDEDYKGSGLQKGHMVRYFDPAWGDDETLKKTAMGDTFHYTNCCPQIGKYNAGIWNDLEDYYMAKAIFRNKQVSVFSGPVFNKAKKIGALLVPLHFWKIIVYLEGGALKASGFLISQEPALAELAQKELVTERKIVAPQLDDEDVERLLDKLKSFEVKVAFIEEKTGLQFGLNDADVHRAEERLYNKRIGKDASPPSSNRDIKTFEVFSTEAEDRAFLEGI